MHLWLLLCIPCTAASYPEIVIDVDSGLVLHQQQVFDSWYPASLTKMMTLYLTFAALQSKEISLEEQLKVSARAASQPGSRLGLARGETITVEDAILAVATVSANDAAVLLAERLAGSEDNFARRMNGKATILGMYGSSFRNASGLPDSQQTTTARDMVQLGNRLVRDFPDYFHYFSNRSLAFKGRQRSSTNGLIGSYAGADGIKSGFTCDAGYNMVASAERDGIRLMAVVLGSQSPGSRNRRIRRLLDQGFKKAATETAGVRLNVLEPGPPDNTPPAARLSDAECLATSVLNRTPLPGWGVLLGVYSDRKQASSAAWKARSKVMGIAGTSRPAILERRFNERSTWKVLLVGFSKTNAGKGCKHLLSHGLQCIAQSPQVMNGKGFAQR